MFRRILMGLVLTGIVTICSSSVAFHEDVRMVIGKNPPPVKECAYVGVKKCAFCHVRLDDSVKTWAITKHANALATLRSPEAREFSENPEEDPKCLKCHVTGTGSDRSQVKDSRLPAPDKFHGVQCEMRHAGITIAYPQRDAYLDHPRPIQVEIVENK